MARRAPKTILPRRAESGIRLGADWLGNETGSPAGDVPVERSSFVGRAVDLAAVMAELSRGARLCTIAGPGGIGKTRLLVELGRHYAANLGSEHVRLCDLSQARSADEL